MSLAKSFPTTPAMIKSLQEALNMSLSLANRSHEAHWNVKGEDFGQLHALFGDFYDFLAGTADDLAERIVQLDGKASAQPSGSPLSGDAVSLLSSVQSGAEALGEKFIAIIKASKDDPSTNNLVMGQCQSLEKFIWKIQASHQSSVKGMGSLVR